MNLTPLRPDDAARHRANLRPRPHPHRPSRRHLIGAAALIAVIALVGVPSGTALGSSARVAGERLFPRSAVPATRIDPDRRSIELGMRFRVTVRGRVTGVRYFGTPANKGSHRASLWSDSGRRLASAWFPPSVRTGWRLVRFAHPVSVVPRRTYVVSYHAGNGRYASTGWGFRRHRSRGHLRAPTGAGVYRYSTRSRFPTQRWHRSNYYVDVRFVPARGSGATHHHPSPPPTGTAHHLFPTARSAGLPAGWTPKRTINGTLTIRTPGRVVEDLRVNGDILVEAPDVTLRRVEVVGGRIDDDPGSTCFNGMRIEDSTVLGVRPTSDRDLPAVGTGGYTAINVKIEGKPEGFRDGGNVQGCTATTIVHSYAHITAPDECTDWHGDALQGFGGPPLKVRNTYLALDPEGTGCYGTAPFFYPKHQGNRHIDVDGLIVDGSAGYMFRDGMPGTVRRLYAVKGTWIYSPIVDVYCPALTVWQARVARLDAAGQPIPGRRIRCTGDGI